MSETVYKLYSVMTQAGNQEDIAKYSKRTVRVTQQHNDECKRLLTLMGVPIINVSVAMLRNQAAPIHCVDISHLVKPSTTLPWHATTWLCVEQVIYFRWCELLAGTLRSRVTVRRHVQAGPGKWVLSCAMAMTCQASAASVICLAMMFVVA